MSLLFIVLQDDKGRFGPIVEKTMFRASNIYPTASIIGKLTKDHLKTWFEKVYFLAVGIHSVLFVDCWTSNKDKEMIKRVTPKDKEVEVLTIPAGTTSMVQPLDVHGFRMWTNFVRRFSDRVRLDELDVDLFQRNKILKLQSLFHKQFSSPRFVNFIKNCWFASGYIEDRPERFENPVDYCFNILDKTVCIQRSDCNNDVFIVCWCKSSLCFTHFYIDYNDCNVYRQ
jgi:hypothetical protein